MALTYGFFDSYLTDDVEDRLYNAEHLVEYCAKIIGSGVCVTDSEESFKVSYSSGVATVAPGFLFIQGYWLKNTTTISMNITGSGEFMVYAQLDLTARLIRVASAPSGATPGDALILARINTSTSAVTDLRADTSVCGIIDTAGSLSDKVTSVQQYVNDSVTGVLDGLRADIQAEVTQLRNLQGEAQTVINNMSIPVGELKYSLATQSAKWLKCDGRYISRTTYPELCNLLKGQSITTRVANLYSQNIGSLVSNGCVYDDKFWFVDFSTRYLVSVALVSGESENIGDTVRYSLSAIMGNRYSAPTASSPLCLSVYNGRFYLTRVGSYYSYGGSGYITVPMAAWRTENGSLIELMQHTLNQSVYKGTNSLWSGLSNNYPYASEVSIDGVNYLAFCSQNANMIAGGSYSEAYLYTRCSFIPGVNDANHTYADGDFSLLNAPGGSTVNSSDDSGFIRTCPSAFSVKNGGAGLFVSIGKTRGSDKSIFVHTGTVPSSGMKNASGDFDSWGSYPTILPIKNTLYCLIDVRIRSNGFMFLLTGCSDGKIYVVEINMAVPAAADVFLESSVYAEGYFFVFVGCGLFVTSDPTSASAYSYIDLTVIQGFTAIRQFGYIGYDGDNQQLVIFGIDTEGVAKVYTISLNRWLVSDTGSYLPKISRNGVPAYIKAVGD